MEIKNILAKYENFYKGGSGYTFQVEVDDFNEIVKYIEELENMTSEEIVELKKEIKEHCETKGLLGRQVFALSKQVDKQYEEIERLNLIISIGLKRIQELEKEKHVTYE